MKGIANTNPRVSTAERLGRRLMRGLVRWEARAAAWLIKRGLPAFLVQPLLWAFNLIILALAVYTAWWIALLLIIVLFAAKGMAQVDQSDTEWFPEAEDHRDELFYHPLNYNDDPDPRFEDDQH